MIPHLFFAAVCPLGATLLALLTFNYKKHPVQIAAVLGLCFAIAFYGLRLDSSNDIARHIALLQNYERVDVFHCFGAGHYDALFVWDIWCWIVAKIGDPYLLQSSAAFVGYAIIGYIVADCSGRLQADRYITAAAFFHIVAAIPFLWVVCGIRSTIALLVCALAAYLYFTDKIKLSGAFILSLVGVFIHFVAILSVLLLLMSSLIASSPVKGIALIFAVTLASAVIGNLVYPIIEGIGNPVAQVLASALEAFLGYSEGDNWTEAQSSSLNTRVNIAFTFLWILFLVYNVVRLEKSRGANDKGISSMNALSLSVAAVTVALSSVLESNGTRLVPVLFALGETSVIARMAGEPPSANKSLFVVDCIGMILASALFVLHGYSVAYGIVETSSFISTAFFGVIGAFL